MYDSHKVKININTLFVLNLIISVILVSSFTSCSSSDIGEPDKITIEPLPSSFLNDTIQIKYYSYWVTVKLNEKYLKDFEDSYIDYILKQLKDNNAYPYYLFIDTNTRHFKRIKETFENQTKYPKNYHIIAKIIHTPSDYVSGNTIIARLKEGYKPYDIQKDLIDLIYQEKDGEPSFKDISPNWVIEQSDLKYKKEETIDIKDRSFLSNSLIDQWYLDAIQADDSLYSILSRLESEKKINYNNAEIFVIDDGLYLDSSNLNRLAHINLKKNVNIIPGLVLNQTKSDSIHSISVMYDKYFLSHNSKKYDKSQSIGHGTAIVGIISAIPDSGIGIRGISPKVPIIIHRYKEFIRDSAGAMEYGSIIRALDSIKKHYDSIKKRIVINISVGLPNDLDTVKSLRDILDSLYQRNIIVVCAAGDFNTDTNLTVDVPASFTYRFPNVISVGSSEKNNSVSNFSKYAKYKKLIDLLAPGNYIQTTGVPLYNDRYDPYPYWQGTSFSSPMVVSTIALMLSIDSTLDADTIRSILRNNANQDIMALKNVPIDKKTGKKINNKAGFGLLNVRKCIEAVLNRKEGK